MKYYLSLYRYTVGLGKGVLDLDRMQIMPRITNEELQRYYEETIHKIREYPEYFQDQSAFQKTLDELLSSKRIELVAKDPPNMLVEVTYPVKNFFLSLLSKEPSKEYTLNERTFTLIPLGKGSPFSRYSDNLQREGRSGEEQRIEVVNDLAPSQAKILATHGTLHHFIVAYQINSRRLFMDSYDDKSWRKEKAMNELVVEELTDLMLEEDKDALFECRWIEYKFNNYNTGQLSRIRNMVLYSTFLIGVAGVIYPVMLLGVLVPGVIGKIAYNKFRRSKREELIGTKERKEIKI